MIDFAQMALELALREVVEQEWLSTQQFFRAHTLQKDNGLPVTTVLAIQDRFDVYFHLEKEPYFLVIPVNLEQDKLKLYHCRAEAKSRVYLGITSETVTAAELTARIGLEPTENWKKGAPNPTTRGRINYKFHGWFLDPSGNGPGGVDQKLQKLLDLTDPYAAAIRELSEEGDCSVWVRVPYSGYQEQMWGVGVDPRDLQRLAALGAGLDIDLYAYGPPLAETD
jgi:Domain of unknown function (DUF4279)